MKQYEESTFKNIQNLLKDSFEMISSEYYVLKSQRNDLEVNLNILLSEEQKLKGSSSKDDFMSPRKEDRKKTSEISDQMNQIRNQLDELNQKLKSMNEKRNELNDSIDFLDEFMKDMDESDLLIYPNSKKKNMKVIKKESPLVRTTDENHFYQLSGTDLNKLDHYVRNFSNISAYSTFDQRRTAVELMTAAKEMKEIIYSAKEI